MLFGLVVPETIDALRRDEFTDAKDNEGIIT
jgi:hypothetical protein